MIERALAKAAGRVRFELADAATVVGEGPFALVVHLNCPVLFNDVAAALAEGGTVVVAASHGTRTPFYTSYSALRRASGAPA